jgi:hypothetical protein
VALCYKPEGCSFDPLEVIGFFKWPNPSRNEYRESAWGKMRLARKVEDLTAICEPCLENVGASTSYNPMGIGSFTFYFIFKELRYFASEVLGLDCYRSLLLWWQMAGLWLHQNRGSTKLLWQIFIHRAIFDPTIRVIEQWLFQPWTVVAICTSCLNIKRDLHFAHTVYLYDSYDFHIKERLFH